MILVEQKALESLQQTNADLCEALELAAQHFDRIAVMLPNYPYIEKECREKAEQIRAVVAKATP